MQLGTQRYTRRGLFRGTALAGTGIAGLALFGCGNPQDEDSQDDSSQQQTGDDPVVFSLVDGWYRDRAVQYYDFGMNTPLSSGSSVLAAPLYVLITGFADDAPVFVEGQHNITPVIPGDEGYSDLWDIQLVTVPEDYEADSIRSADDVLAGDFEIQSAGFFVNCPIVPEGSTLEGGEPLVQGWYDGDPVFYPDFGMNQNAAIPIWAFITGFDGETPLFVDGQHNIIDSVPGDAGYSAFWRVNLVTVPEDYEAESIRSAADVTASGYDVAQTDLVVNCPVTFVQEEEPTPTATAPAPTATQPAPTATQPAPTATPTAAAPEPPDTGSGGLGY